MGFHGKIPYSVWNVFISISSFISSLPYIWEISVQIWIQFQRRSERPLHSLQYDHSTWKNENGRNQIPSMLSLPWLLKTGNSLGCLPLWTTWPGLLSPGHQCQCLGKCIFTKEKTLIPQNLRTEASEQLHMWKAWGQIVRLSSSEPHLLSKMLATLLPWW